MDTQIIELKCPSCGSTNNINVKKLKYGVEFVCDHCGTTSVAVINNELYMPRPGERICIKCGRVSSQDARFCQCRESLVKKCINPNCLREISVNHPVCEHCGWRQDVSAENHPSTSIKIEQAIQGLSDPDEKIQYSSLDFLRRVKSEAVIATPALIEYIQNHPENESTAIEVIKAIGESASSAIPFFTERLKSSKDLRTIISMCDVLIDITSPSEHENLAVSYLINIIESSETPQWIILEAIQVIHNANKKSHSESVRTINALSKLVMDSKSIKDVKKAAFDELASMGPETIKTIPKIIFTPYSAHTIIDWSDTLSAEDAIHNITAKFKDTGNEDYVDALGKIGSPAIPGLIHCLQLCPNENTATHVCDQIKKIGDSAVDALPGLIETLKTIKQEEKQNKNRSKWDLISAQNIVLDTIATFDKSLKSVIPELEQLTTPFNNTLMETNLKEKTKDLIKRAKNNL